MRLIRVKDLGLVLACMKIVNALLHCHDDVPGAGAGFVTLKDAPSVAANHRALDLFAELGLLEALDELQVCMQSLLFDSSMLTPTQLPAFPGSEWVCFYFNSVRSNRRSSSVGLCTCRFV